MYKQILILEQILFILGTLIRVFYSLWMKWVGALAKDAITSGDSLLRSPYLAGAIKNIMSKGTFTTVNREQ